MFYFRLFKVAIFCFEYRVNNIDYLFAMAPLSMWGIFGTKHKYLNEFDKGQMARPLGQNIIVPGMQSFTTSSDQGTTIQPQLQHKSFCLDYTTHDTLVCANKLVTPLLLKPLPILLVQKSPAY